MYEELTIAELTTEARRIYERDNKNGSIGDNWFIISEYLEAIHKKVADSEIFKNVCKEVGIFWRTSYYLLDLRKHFIQHDIEPPQGISWKMLVTALPILTWRNQREIFSHCREKTLAEMKIFAKTYPRD